MLRSLRCAIRFAANVICRETRPAKLGWRLLPDRRPPYAVLGRIKRFSEMRSAFLVGLWARGHVGPLLGRGTSSNYYAAVLKATFLRTANGPVLTPEGFYSAAASNRAPHGALLRLKKRHF